MFSPTVAGPAETRRHAELGTTSLVLRRVARRVVTYDARIDPDRWVRGPLPARNRRFGVAGRGARRTGGDAAAAAAAVWL